MTTAWIAIKNIDALNTLNALNDITVVIAYKQLEKQRLEQLSSNPYDQTDPKTPARENPWYNSDNNSSKQNARGPNDPSHS